MGEFLLFFYEIWSDVGRNFYNFYVFLIGDFWLVI